LSDKKGKILWVDDEIELLRPHIIFLRNRNYDVTPVTNAEDAIALVQQEQFDLILLDEMLHGMGGLSALSELKDINPSLPVIMVTKNEAESLMEDAIGAKIDDYLTKPVNPSQILLICKKILERRKIASERISRDYISEFTQIAQRLLGPMNWQDWMELYVTLSERDLELDEHPELGLRQTMDDQKRECNIEFGKYIEREYAGWLANGGGPTLSVDLIKNYVKPLIEKGERTIFLVVDNLRLDQWLTIEPLVRDYFRVTRDYYFSILPTATPYSRNAIFSGLFPSEIEEQYPDLWHKGTEDDDQSRNRKERQLLDQQLARLGISLKPDPKYVKIIDINEARSVEKRAKEYAALPLASIVLNFVDILAHSRSNSEVIKEMIPNESAFRSLTRSWFEHSHIYGALKEMAASGTRVVVTSDHGSIRGLRGVKVIGDRETSTSLRYKYGRNLKVDSKHALIIRDPKQFKLPARGVNTDYLIAKEDFYFVYPTNFHYYLNYYRDSFQHGGISMEEMILPVMKLEPK
jgi:DNA-binding response OmpR family regulator